MNDAAMTAQPYERLANDAYMTPAWCTEALLRNVRFDGGIWEPAAGDGKMADVMIANGYRVFRSDVHPLASSVYCLDFFAPGTGPVGDIRNIVTNPPYECAQDFIEHALLLANLRDGVVAMLLRNEYDSAKSRRHLFADHPAFALKLVLTRRPKWFADGGASPRHNFAWFVWDWQNAGPARIDWDQ